MKLIIIILLFLANNFSLIIANYNQEAVKVSFKLSHSQIKQGDTLLIEFNFKIKKGWHIYWTNPGDAGLPTIIEPLSTTLGQQLDVLMPVPKRLTEEDLTFYCYENQTTMIARFVIDTNISLGSKTLDYEVSWLVCKNECFPGKVKFNIPIIVSETSRIINQFNLEEYPKYSKLSNYNVLMNSDKILVSLSNIQGELFNFYPINTGYFLYNLIEIKRNRGNYELILPLDKFREKDPEIIEGLFVLKNKTSKNTTKSFYSTIILTNQR